MIEAASTIVDQSRAPGALQLLAAKDPPTQPASTVTGSTRPIFMSSSTSARWLRSYLRTPVLRVSIASDGRVSQTHYHSKTEAASMTLCGGEALWRCGPVARAQAAHYWQYLLVPPHLASTSTGEPSLTAMS